MKIHVVFHSRKLRAAFIVSLCLLVAAFALISVKASAATPETSGDLKQAAGGKTMLVDFYSPFCGTCQMMAPHLVMLEARGKDKLVVKHIDVTKPENSRYAKDYDIIGTPTYVLYNADGKPVYRSEELISPAVLEKQVLRSIGQLKQVDLPSELMLPAAATPENGNDIILLSFENSGCTACKTMTPYLTGFEMTEQSGFHIVHLDTDTPSGKQLMEKLAIKKLPSYVLLDNNSAALPNERGELFRVEGEVKPLELWELVKTFSKSGV